MDPHSEMFVYPSLGLSLLICEAWGLQSSVPSLLSYEDVICDVATGPFVLLFSTGSPAETCTSLHFVLYIFIFASQFSFLLSEVCF